MKIKAFLLIVLAGVLWGMSPLFVSYLSPRGFSSLHLTAVRSAVSAAVLLVFLLIAKRSSFRVGRLDVLLFLLNAVGFVGTATFYFQAIKMTSASTAVVLMYTAPIYVLVFSVLFLRERLTPLKLSAMALMLVGCFFVSGVIGGFHFDALGVLFGVLSGLSYGTYNIVTKILMRRGANPTATTFYTFLFAAAISTLTCNPASLFGKIGDSSALTAVLLVFLGIATCVAPYFLYTLAMRELSAGVASSLGIVEPMAATVMSAIFLSDIPSPISWVGIVLILGAVVLLGIAEKKLGDKEKTLGDKNEQND